MVAQLGQFSIHVVVGPARLATKGGVCVPLALLVVAAFSRFGNAYVTLLASQTTRPRFISPLTKEGCGAFSLIRVFGAAFST